MELKDIIEAGLTAQNSKIDAAIAKFEGQLKDNGTVSSEVVAEVRTLTEQYKQLSSTVNEVAQKQGAKPEMAAKAVSAGQEFIKSEQFKQLVAGNVHRARLEVKNTVTSDSTTVFPYQKPGVIGGDFAPTAIRALFRTIPVNSNMVNSLREDSWTNSAAEASQGSAKKESDAVFEQYNVAIQTVAHWIKISNQLLADAPAVVAYIETRLRDGLAQRIDAQLLNGNGTTPNLSGLTDSGNFTAYTPTSDDTLADAINRAKYTLWAIGNMPDVVIVNPADWGALERLREGAGSGMYLYGVPGAGAGMSPFGVNVVLSQHMAAGKFWIGNINNAAVLYNRSGAVIEMGYVNDDFTKNLITIRAEERLGLGVERPSAALYGNFTA